jgi:uncharacterized caspase-like protein
MIFLLSSARTARAEYRRSLVMPRLLLVILLLMLVPLAGAKAEDAERIALVVGNASYEALPHLANPEHDAQLMDKALKSVGFETITVLNASRRDMVEALKQLTARIGPNSSVVVYYAGHGIQFDNENYLIPADSVLSDSESLPFEAFSLKIITEQIARAQPRIAVFVLDACRNNPLELTRSAGASQGDGATRGLARATGPLGTYIAYATAPGQVATDGTGGNSPFTRALAGVLTTPGLPIEQVFKRVRERVVEETGGKQIPWDNSSLIKDFFFRDALGAEPVFSAEETKDAQAWQTASAADTPAAYKAYKDGFPNGLFADIADNRLDALQSPAADDQTDVAALTLPQNRTVDAASDLLEWNRIVASNDAGQFRQYLDQYPDGLFSKLARLRLEDLSKEGVSEVSSLDTKLAPNFAEFEETPLYPDITDCDRQAGHVQEIADPAIGVYFSEIKPEAAVPACLTALKQYPDSLRILVNYARAIDAQGRHDEAREIYRMGAQKGFAIAMRSLGDVYRDGRGVAKNLSEARYWYVLGAAKQNVFAEYNLALIYQNGLDVEADRKKAAFWLWRAARQGFAPAMQRLANYYLEGDVLPKDEKQARLLLQGSAEMGNLPARLRYGEILLQGLGGERDETAGRGWVEAAARAGYPNAQAKLGILFRDGAGGEKNDVEALNWLTLANRNGIDYAGKIASDLAAALGQNATDRAAAFADNFVATK